MSTNKTPNYNLHSWLPQDEFHVTEVNENFTAIDKALMSIGRKIEAVMGRYIGDGEANRLIDLGRKPIAVIAEKYGGFRQTGNVVYGGLATQAMGLSSALLISDTGFTVSTQNYMQMNDRNTSYNYIAFFEG